MRHLVILIVLSACADKGTPHDSAADSATAHDTGTETCTRATPDAIVAITLSSPAALDGYAMGIDAGDVDGDGDVDLVGVGFNTGEFETWLNQGDGTFDKAVTGSADQGFPVDVALADLDGDGILDAAVAGYPSGVSVFSGQGNGKWSPTATMDGNGQSLGLLAGDLDDDGAPDLVVVDDGEVGVLLNAGDGTFLDEVDVPIDSPTAAGTLADIDGDGHLDIVVGGGASVDVLTGDGTGAFSLLGAFADGSSNGSAVAVGDVDGDCIPDIAYTNYGSGSGVLFADGNGSFGDAVPLSGGGSALSIDLTDLDRDGDLDLVVPEYEDGSIGVFGGHGDGSFEGETTFPAIDHATMPIAADLDGDGLPDLAVSGFVAPNIVVLLTTRP